MNYSIELVLDGKLLKRGFWVYVIKAVESNGEALYYVGRTGDSSSNNAQSPFNRLTSHLSVKPKGNSLMKNLQSYGVKLEDLILKMHFHGPVYLEQDTFEEHKIYRDKVAVLERKIANQLKQRRCIVMGLHTAPREAEREEIALANTIAERALEL